VTRALIVTDGDAILHVVIVLAEQSEGAAKILRGADPGQLFTIRTIAVDHLLDVVRAMRDYTADACHDGEGELPLEESR
jgi:hypothetical protein